MKLRIKLIEARLRAPFVWGSGSVGVRELLLVSLEGSDGQVGFGEAAPLEPYYGVSTGDVRAALEDCRAVLAGSSGAGAGEMLAECARVAVLPQAIAALDLAIWDLAGRRAEKPRDRTHRRDLIALLSRRQVRLLDQRDEVGESLS